MKPIKLITVTTLCAWLAGCQGTQTGTGTGTGPTPTATPGRRTAENVRCPINGRAAPEDLSQNMCIETVDLPAARTSRAALLHRVKWDKSVLKVRFMNGDPALHERVKAQANKWSDHCRIRFDYGDHHPADIRVSFTCGGHWSHVGSATSHLADNQPTMNLSLERNTRASEVARITLHEFGHALGLIHEHQSPNVTVQWDVPKVLDFYRRTQGWDERKTRNNVLSRQSGGFVTATPFDPKSIMLYPIPNALTLDDFETDWNAELSARDIELIGRTYPRR